MTSKDDPWNISHEAYPYSGNAAEQLRFLVSYAILAPSGHNTQPWKFKIGADSLELYADRTRALPVADPEDRELTISCGAAAYFLLVAARYFGWRGELEWLPDTDTPDLLARFRLATPRLPTRTDGLLFRAIPKRCTTRLPYGRRLPTVALMDTLEAIAKEEGAWLHVINESKEKNTVARLIAEGDRLQMAQKPFRRELAAWIHPAHSASHDGLPAYAFGLPALLDFATPGYALAVRTFDMGDGIAAQHEKLALGSPVLLILGTDQDSPKDWLVAGAALGGILLRACGEGVTASYLNQPCEVAELRARLKDAIGHSGFPQLILRMGYGPETPHTPRRPADEVIED